MNGHKPTVTISITLNIVLDGEKERKLLQLLLEREGMMPMASIPSAVTEKTEPTIAEELVKVIKKTAAKVKKVDDKSASKLKTERKKKRKGTSWNAEQDDHLLSMWDTSAKKKSGGKGFTYSGKEHIKFNGHFGTNRTQASIVQRLWHMLNTR